MNNTLSDFTNGVFRTTAQSTIIPATGELAGKILDLAKAKLSVAGIEIGNDTSTWDLYPLFSILVSSGWNKNTDVFDNIELWRGRHSPRNKPVNIMHSQGDIIGHIIDNIVVGEDLQPIPEFTAEADLPSKLHIITAGVIYKIWEQPKKQAEINKLIASIESGRSFVSMECLFKSFDYALVNKSTGDERLLSRNDETNFLTKKLRQYGGEGSYQNFSIGRLLRDITFSAMGIVDNPANPESIISPSLNIFNSSDTSFSKSVYINLDQLNRELTMSETIREVASELKPFDITLHPEYKSLVNKLEVVTAKLAEVDKAQVENLNKAIAAKDKEVEDMKAESAKDKKSFDEMIDEKEKKAEKVKALEAELETTKAELDAEKKTREAYEAASRKSSRTQAVLTADPSLTKEQAVATVDKFVELNDNVFAAMVDILKNSASRAPKSIAKVLEPVQTEESPALGVTTENSTKAFYSQVKDAFKKGGVKDVN